MTKLVYIAVSYWHNHDKEFVETGVIDPVTLEAKVKAVTKKLKARQIHALPDDLADEILKGGPEKARVPTPQEVQLYELSQGAAQ